MDKPRYCPTCGDLLVRGDRCHDEAWSRQRFCSRKCGQIACVDRYRGVSGNRLWQALAVGELTGPLAAEYERRKVSVRKFAALVECD